MGRIKLMLVDDQRLVREGLGMILSLCSDFEIIGEAANGSEAISLVEKEKPDIILMDIRMPKMDGVAATKVIKDKYPQIKIIILTTFNEDEYILEGLKNGAEGYILKDLASDEIIKGIKTVHNGNILLQPEIATKVVKSITNNKCSSNDSSYTIKGEYENLSPREMEISKLIAEGKSNKEISQLLYITEGTVKNHITKILAKLDLRDRTQLALYVKAHRICLKNYQRS